MFLLLGVIRSSELIRANVEERIEKSIRVYLPYYDINTPQNGKMGQETAFNKWLDKLGKGENCPPEGMIDSNGLKSYGLLCFQEGTFKHYAKRYDLYPNAEEHEIINFIADPDEQRKLATLMIKEDRNNYRHWLNTTKRIGLPPEI